MRCFFLLILLSVTLNTHAQNIFPVKLEGYTPNRFCLDCGDIKTSYVVPDFERMVKQLNQSLDLKGLTGLLKFQVIVDSTGSGRVLSHNDLSKHQISTEVSNALNAFKNWIPARTKGKTEPMVSITVGIVINNNQLSADIERVNFDEFRKAFDHPQHPKITNTTYDYKNEHFKRYSFISWRSTNSTLINNFTDDLSIDKDGMIWLIANGRLVNFNGKNFNTLSATDVKGSKDSFGKILSDPQNIKWIYAFPNLYSSDGKTLKLHELTANGLENVMPIASNDRSGETFFSAKQGLAIHKNGKWSSLNKTTIKTLPSDSVYFAQRDSKNRLWIGTGRGTVMIDASGKETSFNQTETVLKNKYFNSMDEDENGNLYFALRDVSPERTSKEKSQGIAVMAADGTFSQFTTDNSGLPVNRIKQVLYDKWDKVLWLSTEEAGLVRYNLKDSWENYHNKNSGLPTSFLVAMTFDKNGNLYIATGHGLAKMERR